MRGSENNEHVQRLKIMDHIPDGWGVIGGASNAPFGYVWINNRKSLFGGEYEHALVPWEIVYGSNHRGQTDGESPE